MEDYTTYGQENIGLDQQEPILFDTVRAQRMEADRVIESLNDRNTERVRAAGKRASAARQRKKTFATSIFAVCAVIAALFYKFGLGMF